MNDKNGFIITNRDRVLRAWQASTQLVREYQDYAHEMETEDDKLERLLPAWPKMKRSMLQSCWRCFKIMIKINLI